jgi:hypothetical protein
VTHHDTPCSQGGTYLGAKWLARGAPVSRLASEVVDRMGGLDRQVVRTEAVRRFDSRRMVAEDVDASVQAIAAFKTGASRRSIDSARNRRLRQT